VIRDDDAIDLDSEGLVLGDLILLEEGSKIPADIRLISDQSLVIDESLLTGESVPMSKDSSAILDEKTPLTDRIRASIGPMPWSITHRYPRSYLNRSASFQRPSTNRKMRSRPLSKVLRKRS